MSVVIGIDPDSEKHGAAIYIEGVLTELGCYDLWELMEIIRRWPKSDVVVHIENVCGNNAAFAKAGIKNKMASSAISRSVGRCQQAQKELERICYHMGIDVIRHKISSMWKKDKLQFESATGWTARSNQDSRSAAYFGYIGLTYNK